MIGARLAVAVALTACHAPPAPAPALPAPPPDAAPAPGRDAAVIADPGATPPPPDPEPAWQAPPAVAFALPSGVRVLLIENHRLPLVSLRLIAHRAGAREDGDAAGRAALTAAALGDGSAGRTAAATRAAFERAGARLAIATSVDDTTVAVDTLAATLAPSLALLADAVRRPGFAGAEVARRRAARVAELRAVPDAPHQIAAAVFERHVLAADHPYAHPIRGVPERVARETRASLRAFWQAHYGPATTTLVVAGDVDRATLARLLDATFGSWRGGPAEAPPPAPPAPPAPRLIVVDRAGAPTSVIAVGTLGPAADDPAYAAGELASAVLAGRDGRLAARLRDQLGVTSAVRGAFWRARGTGLWSASASVDRAHTATAVREILAALAAMGSAEVPGAELDQARARLARAVPREFETTAATATAFERLASLGLPADFYATYPARLAAITAPDVHAIARRAWRDPTIVVVGDWAALHAELAALGRPLVRADSRGRELAP